MKNTIKTVLKMTVAAAICVLFVLRSEASSEGARRALNLCATAIVPSLFPFMAVCSYIMKSEILPAIEKRCEKIFRFLFSLPGRSGVIFLMSLVGGFPVGAKLVADSINNGSLSRNQGKRMMLFCVNPGPAFVVNVVGCSMLDSQKAGVILFTVLSVSALIIGIISVIFRSENEPEQKIPEKKSTSPLVDSVSESTKAITGVCAWILIFSALLNVVNSLEISESAKMWAVMFAEVTNGCMISVKNYPLAITALLLGWAGFSVHVQLMPYLSASGIKYKHFAVARLFNGVLSMGISSLLFKIFPCEISAFSNAGEILPHTVSVSVPATVGLLFLSSLVILDLAPKRKV